MKPARPYLFPPSHLLSSVPSAGSFTRVKGVGNPNGKPMAGYSKLFSSIVTSSIWCEDNATLRVWIAMLATCNAAGEVEGSIPGFASLCRIPIDDMRKSIERLLSPDPDSRTPDNEGRRIVPIRGGWLILNYEAYRNKGQAKDGSRAGYMRDYRKSGKNVTRNNDESRITAPASAYASAYPGGMNHRNTDDMNGPDWAPPVQPEADNQ